MDKLLISINVPGYTNNTCVSWQNVGFISWQYGVYTSICFHWQNVGLFIGKMLISPAHTCVYWHNIDFVSRQYADTILFGLSFYICF